MPLIPLEMQILLLFMDQKRSAVHDLLGMLETETKDKLLERKGLDGVFTEGEKRRFQKKLRRDTITRVSSNRIFDVNRIIGYIFHIYPDSRLKLD